MSDNTKRIIKKSLKVAITAALIAAAAYFLYGAIGSLIMWGNQPKFISPSGEITSSMGFVVQSIVYGCLFLIAGTGGTLTLIFFFLRKKKDIHFVHTKNDKWS